MTSVYISNQKIDVLIGGRSGKKLVVKSVQSEPIAEGCILNGTITDDAALTAQLQKLWAHYKLPKTKLHIVVESSAVNVKTLSVPNVSKEEYLIKLLADNFPENEDGSAIYDYKVLGTAADGGVSVLGCMTERSFINSYIELFKAAGLSIESIDVALGGQIRLAGFLKQFENASYIMSVVDKNTVSQFLFVNGQYRFSNRQRVLAVRDTPEFNDEIARMISSMIQFNQSEKNGAEIANVYFGGFSGNEINSVRLLLNDEKIHFGCIPSMPEIEYKGSANDGFDISDYIISIGNLV